MDKENRKPISANATPRAKSPGRGRKPSKAGQDAPSRELADNKTVVNFIRECAADYRVEHNQAQHVGLCRDPEFFDSVVLRLQSRPDLNVPGLLSDQQALKDTIARALSAEVQIQPLVHARDRVTSSHMGSPSSPAMGAFNPDILEDHAASPRIAIRTVSARNTSPYKGTSTPKDPNAQGDSGSYSISKAVSIQSNSASPSKSDPISKAAHASTKGHATATSTLNARVAPAQGTCPSPIPHRPCKTPDSPCGHPSVPPAQPSATLTVLSPPVDHQFPFLEQDLLRCTLRELEQTLSHDTVFAGLFSELQSLGADHVSKDDTECVALITSVVQRMEDHCRELRVSRHLAGNALLPGRRPLYDEDPDFHFWARPIGPIPQFPTEFPEPEEAASSPRPRPPAKIPDNPARVELLRKLDKQRLGPLYTAKACGHPEQAWSAVHAAGVVRPAAGQAMASGQDEELWLLA